MEWKMVERSLERAFSGKPRLYGDTRVVERKRPYRLAHVTDKMLSPQERAELQGSFEWWPGNVQMWFEWQEVLRVSLLGFGFADCPIVSAAGLELVGNRDARWLCYWGEDQPDSYLALARIEPWDDEVAVSATVSRLLSRNGRGFGVELFWSGQPAMTRNFAPGLVLRSTSGRRSLTSNSGWSAAGPTSSPNRGAPFTGACSRLPTTSYCSKMTN
jgi:hypothetical protein